MKPDDPHDSHDCRPVGEILSQIGGKWTVLIITRLKHGPMRFSELKRLVGGISQKVLTATLRELEMNGFVTRTVTPTIPPRVDYELTDLGRELLVPLGAVSEWATANRQRVLDARKAFLERNPDATPPRIGIVATLQYPGAKRVRAPSASGQRPGGR